MRLTSLPRAHVFAVAGCLLAASILADAPPSYGPMPLQSGTSYGTAASEAYGDGNASIERATRLDHDAAAATDERTREDARREAAQAYEDALDAFERAVELEPSMYEAHTYIGYANRKLARYDRALAAYETALRLKPDYARAIEYQGEAFLGLDRFEDAKRNYLRLYALDPGQANKLLIAMHAWAAQSTNTSNDQRESAAAWLATRPLPAAAAQAQESAPW